MVNYLDMAKYAGKMSEAETVELETPVEKLEREKLEAQGSLGAGYTSGLPYESEQMHKGVQPEDGDYLYRCFLSAGPGYLMSR